MTAPHIRLPFRVGRGGAVEVIEQDTAAEIAQSIAVLARTNRGERAGVPDYGIVNPTFLTSPSAVLESLRQQIEAWEPRATIDMTSSLDAYDPQTRRYTLRVVPKVDVLPTAASPGYIEPGANEPIPIIGRTWDTLGTLTWDEAAMTWDQL